VVQSDDAIEPYVDLRAGVARVVVVAEPPAKDVAGRRGRFHVRIRQKIARVYLHFAAQPKDGSLCAAEVRREDRDVAHH
jgi:hypothetical protein